MTDIVERLHQVQGDKEDAREAAAEIKRLRAEVAILRTTEAAEIERLKNEIERLRVQVERLQANEAAAIFAFRETNDIALEEIKRLRAELADRDRIMNMSD